MSNDDDLTSEIQLTLRGDVIMLPVKASPGSRRNGFTGIHDGALKVAVTQVAEKGKANQAIRKLLSKELGISPSSIALESGELASRKQFAIAGISESELRRRIHQVLSSRS